MRMSETTIRSSSLPVESPITCPICCDHAVEQIEGIVLSARTAGGRDLSQVAVYRCDHWHLFALLYQPIELGQA